MVWGAVGGTDHPDTRLEAVLRGAAIAALPWLGTKYAPMAAVISLLLVARAPREIGRLVAIAVPVAVSLGGWFLWFEVLWGTPSPTAPYGSAHQMALGNLAAGLPGLFFDQEYGIVAASPVLALPRLWVRNQDGRSFERWLRGWLHG